MYASTDEQSDASNACNWFQQILLYNSVPLAINFIYDRLKKIIYSLAFSRT